MATSTNPPKDTTGKEAAKTVASPTTTSLASTSPEINQTNILDLKSDINIMLQYAINHGITIPATFDITEPENSTTLMSNYNILIPAVAPATVESIRYIQTYVLKDNTAKNWYQIPIISRCLGLAILSLVVLTAVSLSPDVNEVNLSAGLLASSGVKLLLNLTFIIAASLLGVMFYLLKTLNLKIKSFTLLPVDSIEINSMILIGVLSGFIISELFIFTTATLGGSIEVHKMTLALLGGFSSDAIFSILQGIVNKVKLFLSASGQ